MLAKKRKENEFNTAKHEDENEAVQITCRVEILLVFFWVKGRGKLEDFGTAGTFGRDGLVVGVARA
jgi:hypothetical protein